MSVYQIGSRQFFSMTRPPDGLKERKVIEARSGVDGVIIRKTGRRGQPFVVRSLVDIAGATVAAAMLTGEAELQNYYALCTGGPYDYVWNDTIYSSVDVLDVISEGPRPLVIGIGGFSGTSKAMLRAEWTLIRTN